MIKILIIAVIAIPVLPFAIGICIYGINCCIDALDDLHYAIKEYKKNHNLK